MNFVIIYFKEAISPNTVDCSHVVIVQLTEIIFNMYSTLPCAGIVLSALHVLAIYSLVGIASPPPIFGEGR